MNTDQSRPISRLKMVWMGFSGGVILAYSYAVVFFLYAMIRLITTSANLIDPPHLAQTQFLLSMSLLLTVLVFTVFTGLGAGLVGAITVWLAFWLKRWLSFSLSVIAVTIVFAIASNLLLMSRVGSGLLTIYLPTYLFWLGFPSLIYIGYGIRAGYCLRQPPG